MTLIPLQIILYRTLVRKTDRYCRLDVVDKAIVAPLTLLWYHGVNVTPVLFDSSLFFETVTNTDIVFHIFFRMTFLTMSHTFARLCVFPFIFYLCLFPLGDKRTPLYLPCSIDNCLKNAENAVCVSTSIYSKVPKTKSCLFVDIWVQTCSVKYYLGEKNIVINCVYIMVFFSVGS